MIDNSGNFSGNARTLTILVWVAVVVVLLIGGYVLMHPHRSHDQRVLIEKSK